MKESLFKIENRKGFYFALILIYFEILYWIIMLCTNGAWICSYFTAGITDTSMDYFNMLSNMQFDTPYAANSNYPAMCFVIWKIMYGLLPKSISSLNGLSLRNYMPAQLGYILIMLVSVILIWELLCSFKIGEGLENKLLAAGLLLSGPLVFTIERGNIIILAFLFLLLFIRLYDSENKYLRIIAYLSLALSASIKIYPALFGILILERKRYKEAGIAVLLGILIFVLPFFAFDGIQSIKDMLNGIFMSSSAVLSDWGTGYNVSFINFIRILGKLRGVKITEIPVIFNIVSIVYCLLLYFFSNQNWQKLFAASLLCIWIPAFSFTYMLIIFMIPFIFYLKEEKNIHTCLSYIYGILFIVILIPIALPNIDSWDIIMPLSFPTVVVNLAIVSLSVLILLESVRKKFIIRSQKRGA